MIVDVVCLRGLRQTTFGVKVITNKFLNKVLEGNCMYPYRTGENGYAR